MRGVFEPGNHEYKIALPLVTDQSSKIVKRKTRVLPGNLVPKEILNKWIGLGKGSIVEAVTDTLKKNNGEILEPQVRYYISSLRYDAPNVEQALKRAIRQHWALEMAFNQDRLQCTNTQYLAGRTLLNKISRNFTTKIQTR